MTCSDILYEVSDRIATVTLNRPEKLNAWTPAMEVGALDAMRRAERDDSVRVIVLTGAGRGFCAGADMQLLQGLSARQGAPSTVVSNKRCYACFPAIEKPVIAAVNGPAVGLGFVLALYCDLRVASELASFSTAFARRGLIAEHGIAWLLPRQIGLGNAADLIFTARKVEAQEALRIGLVQRVYPAASFAADARAFARELADLTSPRSLRIMKRQFLEAPGQTLEQALDLADREMYKSFQSDDFKEGVAHFVEKRPPSFTGKDGGSSG